MAINNPYVPGDPYSYDLKWIVSHIKELDTIYESIDSIIAEQIYKAFQESNLINFKTTEEMLQATLEDGAVVLTDGYHEPGDGGTMIYLIQGFTPEMCLLDYYLTLPGNKIAIPVILFPYVTPVMFGAYGDGIADDTEAFAQAMKMHKPVNLIAKTYLISETMTAEDDLMTISNGTIKMNAETETGFIYVDQAEYVTIKDIYFEGSGVAMPTGSMGAYTAVKAYRADHLTIDNCSIRNVSNGGLFILESSYVTVTNNTLSNFANLDAYGAIVVGYGINQIDMGFQTIQNNTIDGGHFGIECQGWQHDVNISNNKTKNNYGYGILCYLYELDVSSRFQNVQIVSNLVENIHHNTNVGYYNGMGIYAQTIDKLTISNNVLNNIMLDRPDAGSPNRTLAPGAISIAGGEEVVCTGNVVDSSVIDGIDIIDVASSTIGNIVSNNMVNDAAIHGIHVQAAQNVVVADNVFSGTTETGVVVLSHPVKETENVVVTGNMIRCSAQVSLTIGKGTGTLSKNIVVSNNIMTNHTNRGASISDVDTLVFTGNTMTASAAVSNWAVAFTNVDNLISSGNIINGSSSKHYYGGFYFNAVNGSFSGNITKGIVTDSRMYQINSSDITLTNCIDDDHAIPHTAMYSMHYNPTVAGPQFFVFNTMPTTGTYARGSVAFNSVAASGQPAFWICTAAGTPGTWKAGPTIA